MGQTNELSRKPERLMSLDALRGFDMFWIIGGGALFEALAKFTYWPILNWWAGQLQHKYWEGFNFEDLIFPMFLFIATIIYLNTKTRGQVLWFSGLLLGYWAIMKLIPVPGYGAGVMTPEGNLAGYVDRLLLPGKF